jgi:hypothetical protein
MRFALGCVLLGTFTMAACLSTVRVKRDPVPVTDKEKKSTSVSGVPFYIKVAKCKQETSWLQPFYTLTLKKTSIFKFVDEKAAKTKDPTAKPPESVVRFTVTKVLSLSQFSSVDVRNLKAMLSKPGPADTLQAKAIEDTWKKISDLTDYLPLAVSEDTLVGSSDAILTTNTAVAEAVVDYSRVYYYNAPRPWVGTSQLDAKLAGDGTLTEASAQVQGQTLSTILSALPISTLLTKAAGAGAAAATAPPADAVEETFQYDLTIVEDGYTHTHNRYVDFALPCPVETGGVKTGFALTIQPSGQPATKKDDGNTVKVNGSIVLPPSGDKK